MKRSALNSVVVLGVLAAAGCTPASERRSMTVMSPVAELPTDTRYRVGCPDVLTVSFADRPDWDCAAAVDIDGRLPLADAGRPMVDGATLDEARTVIASVAGVDAAAVRVELADPRAGRVYLHGPERGEQRTLPYLGPERAAAFLARVGALKPNCSDPRAVTVVRPNVAGGGSTEVFAVDVRAAGDPSADVVLRPGDQVYVGETKRSRFARLLPDWLRPGFCRVAGLPTP